MYNPKVSIGIILFTGCEKYLPFSLPSLFEQDYPNIEILMRDQSPNGEVYEYLKTDMPDAFEKARIEKGANKMHSGGQNALIHQSSGDIYVVASNDMWYPANFISQIVSEVQKPENHEYGSFSPKLMQWDFLRNKKTDIIDSCGISLKKSHHFFDLGQGEKDCGQYDGQKNIFGASGALTIIKKSALQNVLWNGEYYDELLHYKNDIDLAYRLQWAGEKCRFLPHLKVWHDRQVSGSEGILRSRKSKSKWAKESSLRGHLITLKKNFDHRFSSTVKCRTRLYNFTKFLFILLSEPHLIKTYRSVSKLKPEITAKRLGMRKTAKPATIERLMK